MHSSSQPLLMWILCTIVAGSFVAACSVSPEHSGAATRGFERVQIPDYHDERGIKWTASPEEYAAARADTRYVFEQFTYESDGLTVGAYVYRPKVTPRRAQPVIVFNRGSFTRPNGFAGDMLVMAHRYAQAGFVTVAPHYRGSNGWQGRDELGGAELHDLFNLVPELRRIPGVDTTRLYLSGQSRGGAMVYMALRDGFPARAGAVWGAFTDVEPLIAEGGPQAKYAHIVWPDLEQQRAEILETRSAMRWADRIDKPILIMHGTADDDIPIEQSQRLDAELERLEKTHKFIAFEGEHHFNGRRGAERDAAAIEWFRRFSN